MHSARSLVTAAAIVALFPTAAIGQRAEAWGDSVQRLHALASALRDSMARGDSSTQEVARRGPFVVAASPNNRAVATDALEQFTAISDRWFGGALPSPGGFRLVVRTERATGTGFGRPREIGVVVLAALPDTSSSMRVQLSEAPQGVPKALTDAYGDMMFANVPAVMLWLQHAPSLSTPEAARRQVAMYALVTGSSQPVRDCAGGAMAGCEIAFELTGSPATPAGVSFSAFMRADLMLAALSAGGRAAWPRLRAAADSGIRTALAAAAGMPLDSLLSRWRVGLLSLRPTAGPLTRGVAIAALIWSVALLAGALGTSRWV
jgi:hypothetical protein